jgi:uncharacterized membrane protein YhaH (DUF805 family)
MPISQILFSFSGRISRSEYWQGFAILLPFSILLHVLSYSADSDSARVLIGIIALFGLWPGLALLVKRWHDRDHSAWWLLLLLIPYLNFVALLWMLVEVWFLQGTDGANRFGQDPLRSGNEAQVITKHDRHPSHKFDRVSEGYVASDFRRRTSAPSQSFKESEVGTVPEGVAVGEPTPRCNICGNRVRLSGFAAHMDAHKVEQNQPGTLASAAVPEEATSNFNINASNEITTSTDPVTQAMIDSCVSILTNLGYKVTKSGNDKWDVILPSGMGTHFVYSPNQLQELTQGVAKKHEKPVSDPN